MDIFQYHWVWYLIGITNMPRLTLMIAIDLHTNIPVIAKIIFTIWAGLEDSVRNTHHNKIRQQGILK